MRATSSAKERGHVLAMVLLFVALLAMLSVLLLTSAQYAAGGTRSMEQKNATLDSAEAGLNAALDALDSSLTAASGRTGSLANGYQYAYVIYPNFTGTAAKSIADPVSGGGQVSVPADGAIIVSTGSGSNGERPTVVEAAVSKDTTQMTYPHVAVAAGLDIQGNYNPKAGIIDPSGHNAVVLQSNGNITARIGGGIQGSALAGGSTNTLPPGTTNVPQLPLPTVSQFDYMIASYKNQAQLYGSAGNLYEAGGASLASSYTCTPSNPGSGCVLFYDGPLSFSSGQISLIGPWTLVVNGNLKQAGQAALIFGNQPSLLVVNGNADLSGNATLTAYMQVKGSTQLSGNAVLTGAVMTLGTLSFNGGGANGKFVYNPATIPPSQTVTGLVKVITYAEY